VNSECPVYRGMILVSYRRTMAGSAEHASSI